MPVYTIVLSVKVSNCRENERHTHTKVKEKDGENIISVILIFFKLFSKFEQIYPDPVRVVSIGQKVDYLLSNPENKEWLSFSTELCGGTYDK